MTILAIFLFQKITHLPAALDGMKNLAHKNYVKVAIFVMFSPKPDTNTFGMIWKADWKPCQSVTDLALILWADGSEPLQPGFHTLVGCLKAGEWRLL